MTIRINNLSLGLDEDISLLKKKASKKLRISENEIKDLKIVRKKEDVRERLNSLYKPVRAKNLFNFYLLILIQGLQNIKKDTNRSMYYKNISDLKKAGVDFSQKFDVDMTDNTINFNPFESKEIL